MQTCDFYTFPSHSLCGGGFLNTLDRRQSKTFILSKSVDENLKTQSFRLPFVAHHWRQMAIEDTVSSDFLSAFVDC